MQGGGHEKVCQRVEKGRSKSWTFSIMLFMNGHELYASDHLFAVVSHVCSCFPCSRCFQWAVFPMGCCFPCSRCLTWAVYIAMWYTTIF